MLLRDIRRRVVCTVPMNISPSKTLTTIPSLERFPQNCQAAFCRCEDLWVILLRLKLTSVLLPPYMDWSREFLSEFLMPVLSCDMCRLNLILKLPSIIVRCRTSNQRVAGSIPGHSGTLVVLGQNSLFHIASVYPAAKWVPSINKAVLRVCALYAASCSGISPGGFKWFLYVQCLLGEEGRVSTSVDTRL